MSERLWLTRIRPGAKVSANEKPKCAYPRCALRGTHCDLIPTTGKPYMCPRLDGRECKES